MKRQKPPPGSALPKGPFNNPFSGLKEKLGVDEPAEPVKSAAAPTAPGPARAVVRLERKGRSGKEVTVVEHLELSARQREEWLKALKNGLGCGGSIEGEALVLQGDQRERLEALLLKRGVRKVTIAN